MIYGVGLPRIYGITLPILLLIFRGRLLNPLQSSPTPNKTRAATIKVNTANIQLGVFVKMTLFDSVSFAPIFNVFQS